MYVGTNSSIVLTRTHTNEIIFQKIQNLREMCNVRNERIDPSALCRFIEASLRKWSLRAPGTPILAPTSTDAVKMREHLFPLLDFLMRTLCERRLQLKRLDMTLYGSLRYTRLHLNSIRTRFTE